MQGFTVLGKDSAWIELRSLLSIRGMLSKDIPGSFNPRPNSYALATVGSVMTIGLSINGCLHSKIPVWWERSKLTSPEVWAAATSKVLCDSRRQEEALPGYIGRCIIYKAITRFQVAGYNFMQLAGWKRKS